MPRWTGELDRRFSANLSRLREQAGLTQAQLAKKAGWKTGSYISQIEGGVRGAGQKAVDTLAKALGVDMSEFFARPPERDGFPGNIIVPLWRTDQLLENLKRPSKPSAPPYGEIHVPAEMMGPRVPGSCICVTLHAKQSEIAKGAIACADRNDVPSPEAPPDPERIYLVHLRHDFVTAARVSMETRLAAIEVGGRKEKLPVSVYFLSFGGMTEKVIAVTYPDTVIGRIFWTCTLL
jgi:transcriptional regulator with XRE-family HTH domain